MNHEEEKNYRVLVNQAEESFRGSKYLEAFLLQSCIFEGVVKNYALSILQPIIEPIPSLKQKSKDFEMARLTDELFIAGKIKKDLYENLNKYRKKRNEVIHKILKYKDKKTFEKELKEAYKLGLEMKVFIVEEMVKMKKGKTSAELSAKMEHDLQEVMAELPRAINRELSPMLKKISKDFKNLNIKRQ
ncbi:MAG: hypothetical protein WCT22_05670 [Patescibacteria group bacterium]|jgi:hypothetical protein